MDKALNYSDIYLIPNCGKIASRSIANTKVQWGPFIYSTVLAPANMSSVINKDLAIWCAYNDIPYFYHRFGDTLSFVSEMTAQNDGFNGNERGLISISLGVKGTDRNLLNDIYNFGYKVDIVLIDIAHGFSKNAESMIKYVRNFDKDIFVVAGNVWGDKASIQFLQNVGAQAIKCGLSCGAACSTYGTTGFGSPMFTAALQAGEYASVPLCIDGGLRNNGDIAKAIVAVTSNGGNVPLVMGGSILASCIDSAADFVYNHQIISKTAAMDSIKNSGKMPNKLYFGSASAKQKGNKSHVEGFEVEIPCNGLTFAEKYKEINEALCSSISYAGGKYLDDLKNVKWVTAK